MSPSKSEDTRDLFENAPCGYALLDMDGSIRQVNAAFLKLSGWSAETALQKKFQNLLSSAGSIFWENQIVPVLLLQGFCKEIAFDLLRGPGDRVPVFASMSLRYGSDGQPSRIRLILLEAKERRLYERDLLRSRVAAEQMAEVVLHSSDAIITLTPEGEIQSCNHGFERMLGYASQEVIGQRLSPLIFGPGEHDWLAEAGATLRRGKVVTMETKVLHGDGHCFDASVTLTPHMEAPGVLAAFSAIVRDESVRKLAERALIQSEKLAAVGRMATSIAHEINNPLASVTNLVYLARQSAVNADARRYLETAEMELRRVSILTSQTLRFHKQLTDPNPVACTTLFSGALSAYEGRIRNANIALELRKRAEKPVVCFESDIRQVISHLLTNAIDAMPTGGRLLIRSREATDWRTGRKGIVLTVADTGTGMPKEVQARMSEAFFTTKGFGGTGLGLWISAEIVERHTGRMRIRSSQRPGHTGTVAAIFLPFDTAPSVRM